MPDDPTCRSEACAGRCNRSEHAMQFSTPSWLYGPCRIHRGCKRFADIEPFTPLTELERAEIGRRMDLAAEVLTGRSSPAVEQPQLIEEVRDGRLTEEVVPDGERLIEEVRDGRRLSDVPERVEGPAPADEGCDLVLPMEGVSSDRVRALLAGPLAFKPKRFLGAWDSWWCSPCGSRAFEQRECCGLPMVAVRMEMHAREVPDG